MTIWVRHIAATRWCLPTAFGASIVSACRGRFAASEDYEVDADPPHVDRCMGCERERIVAGETARIERWLAELVRNAEEPRTLEWIGWET